SYITFRTQPRSTPFPYTTLFRSQGGYIAKELNKPVYVNRIHEKLTKELTTFLESFSCQIKLVHEQFSMGNKVKLPDNILAKVVLDRKSTRLNSSHVKITYAVFCL